MLLYLILSFEYVIIMFYVRRCCYAIARGAVWLHFRFDYDLYSLFFDLLLRVSALSVTVIIFCLPASQTFNPLNKNKAL
jgi:hypothetical protein